VGGGRHGLAQKVLGSAYLEQLLLHVSDYELLFCCRTVRGDNIDSLSKHLINLHLHYITLHFAHVCEKSIQVSSYGTGTRGALTPEICIIVSISLYNSNPPDLS